MRETSALNLFVRAAQKTIQAQKAPKSTHYANCAQGKREIRAGLRPPMREAILAVVGDTIVTPAGICDELERRNWLPTSRSPRSYVTKMITSLAPHIERVSRGYYRAAKKAS